MLLSLEAQLNFTLLAEEETGVYFQNRLVESPQINVLTYQYFHNGGGVSIGDINNDGLVDIYFTSNMEPNMLYLNQGDFKFKNISATAKVDGGRGWATGSCMVDINNDGYLDIYVCKSGDLEPEYRRNKLYINNADGTFTENARFYGLDDPSYSTQAYFFDYDRDGDLDMYLLNHGIRPVQPTAENQSLNFERDPNAGDKFFKNENGKFIDLSEEAGIKGSPIGYGLSVSVGDVNGDRFPDLYVCNDYMERDYLYINNQDGTFTDELTDRIKHISNFSMGSDMADINDDGHLDIMIADMAAEDNYRSKTNMSGMDPLRFWNYVSHGFHYQYMINTLQLNNGNATFSEIAQLAGVAKTDWSWAALIADFNSDGYRDMYVTNGLRKEARNNDFVAKKKRILKRVKSNPDSALYYMRQILDAMPAEKIPNYMYLNRKDGRFIRSENSGFETPSFSNGAAYGDLDNDGDLDLVVSNIDHTSFIYRNDSESQNFIQLHVKGGENNRSGIGARITLKAGELHKTVEQYVSRGYLSSVDPKIHIGLGTHTEIEQLDIEWADGAVTQLRNIIANQLVEVVKEDCGDKPLIIKKKETVKTVKKELSFVHRENEFDDFEREVLLPHKMSNLGPAIGVGDVNRDGLDDYYVGGAIGQAGSLFLQNSSGEFTAVQSELWHKNAGSEEVVAYFFDYDMDGDEDLYVGNGGNEYRNGDQRLKDLLYENRNGVFVLSDALPENAMISTGCVGAADFDNDGDLDLFVGNRQTPGKYPYASKSYLLENRNNKFVDVSDELAPDLAGIGMVTNAFWADLNKDAVLELVLSGEWMPITIMEWDNGSFIDRTAAYGLENTSGWWFGLERADLDNDGDLDLIGGNLGLNYKYKASAEGPFQVYSKDMNDDGKNDIVLGYDENGKNYPLRGRQCSSQQIPELEEKYRNYSLFASSTLEEVYEGSLDKALKLEVTDFSSAVFINEAGKFRRVNFEPELQHFNWNSILVRDLNDDGNLDIITAGNLYEAEVETPRCDAGNGLILSGNGDGTFKRLYPSNINWGQHNVKSLGLLDMNGIPAVLIGNNNARLELLLFK